MKHHANRMKACCSVANASLSRLELSWLIISRLKMFKMLKKYVFAETI